MSSSTSKKNHCTFMGHVLYRLIYVCFPFIRSAIDFNFNSSNFQFVHYNDSNDIAKILKNRIKVGDARAKVEEAIVNAGGKSFRSGSASDRKNKPGFGYGSNHGFLEDKIDLENIDSYVDYNMPQKVSAYGRGMPGGRGRILSAFFDTESKVQLIFASGIPTIY